MQENDGFWAGMSAPLRMRFVLGLVYYAIAVAVLSQSPILGIVLLTLPVLRTVLVIWIGSEEGVGFGPHSRSRPSAFAYTLRYVWVAPIPTRAFLLAVLATAVIGGLGWLSTGKMRAELAAPSLVEQVTTTAGEVSATTKETARNWLSTAKGWFSGDEGEE